MHPTHWLISTQVLVNDPPANVRRDLETKLRAIAAVEARIWGERNSGAAAGGAPARGLEIVLDARGLCAVAAAVAGAFVLGTRMRR